MGAGLPDDDDAGDDDDLPALAVKSANREALRRDVQLAFLLLLLLLLRTTSLASKCG